VAPADPSHRRAIRIVAFVEAAKGLLALMAASGLLGLMHHDIAKLAARLVRHLHLDPASHYPHVFLEAAANLHDTRLLLLALGAAAYALVRFAEAGGLLFEKAWAEWLAAISGGIYVPAEVWHFVHRPSLFGFVLFAINLLVVGLMVQALRARRRPALHDGSLEG
jgi:uncharacterized membrane protein (DUF2068 family)